MCHSCAAWAGRCGWGLRVVGPLASGPTPGPRGPSRWGPSAPWRPMSVTDPRTREVAETGGHVRPEPLPWRLPPAPAAQRRVDMAEGAAASGPELLGTYLGAPGGRRGVGSLAWAQ